MSIIRIKSILMLLVACSQLHAQQEYNTDEEVT